MKTRRSKTAHVNILEITPRINENANNTETYSFSHKTMMKCNENPSKKDLFSHLQIRIINMLMSQNGL